MGFFTALGSSFGPFGSLAGQAADEYLAREDQRSAVKAQEDRQAALNRAAIEQEKASIIGRVDAAKAAGIHPLVAMGAQGLGGPVVSAPYVDPVRSYDAVDTFSRQGDADVRRYNAARADLAEVEVQLAMKRLADQPGNGGAPNQLTGTGMVVPADGKTYPVTHVELQGQTLPPAAVGTSYQTPGVAPGWDVIQHSDGVKMVVPGGAVQRENWGEQMGELPVWMLPEVARQSAKASGLTTGQWIGRVLFGDAIPKWNKFYNGLSDQYDSWRRRNHERNLRRNPGLKGE